MADVNWNLALYDPIAKQKQGFDYANQIADQGALLQAGQQYAGGDYASAANTVARRGDFKTAGDLSTLGTRRQAGQLYASGDPAAAGKALASGGDFDTVNKLAEQQIKTIEAQQDTLGRSGAFLAATLKEYPNSAQQAWGIVRQQFQAAQIPAERIAEFEKMYAADPAKTAAVLSHIGTEIKPQSDGQGTIYLIDKYGNVVNKLGEDTLFGNTAEGKALNIVAKGSGTPNYDLAKAYLERQQTQVVGNNVIQGPRFTVPGGQPDAANLQGAPPPAPPPAGGPGASTRVGDRTVTQLGGKPMPAGVQKAEDEDLDAISTATNINNDLKPFQDQLTSGKLTLGPVANTLSNIENYIGQSTEGSRNYGDFRAALEKLRNDSLRLNKGVQTEGDAIRAWNELFNNLNDNSFVAQRLEQIRGINARAAQIRTQNVNIRRQRNNQPAFDWTGFQIPDSPYAAPGAGSTSQQQQTAPVQIHNDAEYNALPSGRPFIAPDGSHRVKP